MPDIRRERTVCVNRNAVAIALMSIVWSGLAAPAIAGEWRLMSHQGGCATLSQAAERNAEFQGVAGPNEFAAKLRGQGIEVRLKETTVGGVKAVELEAPERNLFLMFVTPELCRSMEN